MKKSSMLKTGLSLMLSMSLLAACGPQSVAGNPNSPTTTSQQAQGFSAADFDSQARSALIAYHSADASFSDSQRIAASQGFKVQQLLSGSSDSSSSTSVSISDGGVSVGNDTSSNTSANSDAGADTSTSTSTSTSTNASTNTSGSTSTSGSASTNTDVSAGVNLGGDTNVNAGVNTDVNTGANTGINTDVNTGVNVGTDGTNINTGVNTGTNVNLDGNSASASASLTAGLDNSSSLNLFNEGGNLFRTDLSNTAGVTVNEDGSLDIRSAELIGDIDSRINQNTFLNASDDLDLDFSSGASVSEDMLLRLDDRNIDVRSLELNGTSNATANLQGRNVFGLQFSDRDSGLVSEVVIAQNTDASASSNNAVDLDIRLSERAEAFTQTGSRIVENRANGVKRLSTRLSNRLENGTRIEIFENRFVNAQGEGSGAGSVRLTNAAGESFTADLKTRVKANGELMIMIDPERDGFVRLMTQESASGDANLMVFNDSGNTLENTRLDLSAALDSMAKLNADS